MGFKKILTYSGWIIFIVWPIACYNSHSNLPVLEDEVIITQPLDGAEVADTRQAATPFVEHSSLEDLSIPKPTELQWKLKTDYPNPSFDIYLSDNNYLCEDNLIASNVKKRRLLVWNLKIGTAYYWKVVVKSQGVPVGQSREVSFQTSGHWPRWIWIDGTTNARDIGGVTNAAGKMTRQGLIYRSAEFNQHLFVSRSGIKTIDDLGIRSEIDLRKEGTSALPSKIRYLNVPLVSYTDGLRNYKSAYREIFAFMADKDNYPLIFHCWGGADRAGTVALLLEAVLGWSDEMILREYQWTSLSIWGSKGSKGDNGFEDFNATVELLRSYDTINGSLRKGATNYLRSIGVTDTQLQAIREIMLEPVL